MLASVRYLIEVGKQLKAKKDTLGHRRWLPWLEANADVLGFGDRTAAAATEATKFDAGVEYGETEAKRISREIWGHAARKPTSKPSPDENQQQQLPDDEVAQEVLQDALEDAARSPAYAAAQGAAADIAAIVVADRNLRAAFAKIAPPGWLAALRGRGRRGTAAQDAQSQTARNVRRESSHWRLFGVGGARRGMS